MVRLRNIRKINSEIVADIFPEGSNNPGELKVDKSGKVSSYTLPEDYSYCISHVFHAATFIEKNREKILQGEVTEGTVMWH